MTSMQRHAGWTVPSFCLLMMLVLCPSASARTAERGPVEKPITVTRVDETTLKARLATLKGKVVVVNLWATWCIPCVEEFPHLVTLANRYHDRGLEVIAISIDDIDSLQTAVIPFLMRQRAILTAFIKDTADDERFIDAIDPTWRGAVPTTFIYDRSGILRATLAGKQTLGAFEAVIKPLLDETH